MTAGRRRADYLRGKPLATTVVGSYPQPDWLIDRAALGSQAPPRVRARELWRIPQPTLVEAQDDATELAVRAMERVGLDVITDGEIRRESYSNHFVMELDGVDLDTPGTTTGRNGKSFPVPRIVGEIRRPRPVGVRDVQFVRDLTESVVKATIPGPFTLSQQAQDEFYGDPRSLALAFAAVVNEELRDLVAAGVDVVQLDEPWLQARPGPAAEFAIEAIDHALAGIEAQTALHLCYGYAAIVRDKPHSYDFLAELEGSSVQQVSIEAAQPHLDLTILRELPTKTMIVGVLDLADPDAESVDAVAKRIRVALEHIDPERLMLAPDCGMKYLDRKVADEKLRALVQGAERVRAELA